MPRALRNIAIIAHVDHGKTTLVDKLLRQSGAFAAHQHLVERVMDSNDLERVLSMVDGVLLLVDAVDGPMPQTRFVTKKALALGLKPIVVVNKVDKPGAKPEMVVNAAFDLFDKLGANDEQLDFPVVYASGINGWSSLTEGAPGEKWGEDMSALFDTVLKHVPANKGDPAAPLQLQISALDFSTFV